MSKSHEFPKSPQVHLPEWCGAIGSAVALLLSAGAHAQTQASPTPAALPEVLVRADGSSEVQAKERLEQSHLSLEQRAGGTAVVSTDAFATGKTSTFADMLSYAPGVYAQTRHGDETRLSIRGSGIQRGFLLRGLQLYQDGIALNHADGQGDYQLVDPLATEYIEVWRGANALELGANSLGGAINFVSPTGLTAPRAKAQVQLGSFGYRQMHGAFAAKGQLWDGFFSVTRSLQDGYREQSATRATRLQGNVGLRLSPALDARLYLAHIDSKLQMPGSISAATMEEDRRQAAARYQPLNAHNNYRLNRVAAKLNWQPSEQLQWVTSIYTHQRQRDHAMIYGFINQDFRDAGLDTRATVNWSDGALVRKLVAGASYQRMGGDESRFANPDGNPGNQTGSNRLTAAQTTMYAEYTHGLTAQWLLQAGAQVQQATRRLTNRYTPANSYGTHYSGTNPKLGLIYRMDPQSQWYANVSRSSEAPPFGELVVSSTLPLAWAQKATTFELGYRTRRDNLQVDASIYRSRIHGELLSLTDANGVALGTVNADRTIHQGVELGAAWQWGATRWRANYLYSDFRFAGDPVYGNKRLAGMAPHVLNAEVRWQASKAFWIAPAIEARAGKTWIDHANTVSTSGFALFNLSLGGEIQRGLNWFVQARNLADRRYVAGTAVQADAAGKDGNWYFPGDGRAVYAGLQWALD